jgi:hypothetical protein
VSHFMRVTCIVQPQTEHFRVLFILPKIKFLQTLRK